MTTKGETTDKELSKVAIIRFVAPGAVPQMGWSLSEAVIIPLFLSMGVSANQLNFVYAVVPLVSLFLHPACGMLSDLWGLRKPFIFVFYVGFLIGISMIVLLPAFFPYESWDSDEPPKLLLFLLLGGTCLQDLSLELITNPTRALLNDNLPESQLSQGNSYYSLFSDMACILTFAMTLAPMERLVPSLSKLTSHPHELALYIGTVFFSMIFILLGLTQPEAPEEEETEAPLETPQGDEEEALLAEERPEEEEGDEAGEEEAEPEETEEDDTPGLRQLWNALTVLPVAVFVLWCFQFFFVHVTVQLSFWWPTYVGVEIFGGSPGKVEEDGGNKYQDGVNFSVAGLLFQAICSFLAGNLVVPVNIYFGVANAYILAGVIFGLASSALYFFPSRVFAMCFMGVSGVVYPFLQTNPFILLELLMRDDVQEADVTTATVAATAGATTANALLPPLINEDLTPVPDDTKADQEHYSLDATRGVLTSFINMSLPAAQISGAGISYIGVTYLGNYSTLFLVSGLALLGMSLLCFVKRWLTLEEETGEDEGEGDEEEEEEEEEEEAVQPQPLVTDDSTTDDEFAERQRLIKEAKAKRREAKRAARRLHKSEHEGKKRPGPFLLPRTRSDAHTSGGEGGSTSGGEGLRRRHVPRSDSKKNADWRLYGDGNMSAPETLPSRRTSKQTTRLLARSPQAKKEQGYMTFDESVSHRRNPSEEYPEQNESKLMDRRSKQLRKVNAERRRAKRIKALKQEASYFQQRHARGQVWLPPAADSEATVASEVKKRMERARVLALTQQRFGLIASKRPGARLIANKDGGVDINSALSPWIAPTIESNDLTDLRLSALSSPSNSPSNSPDTN